MYFDLCVGMPQRTSELPCILGINRHTRTNQIECLDGSLRQLLQCLWLNRERSREFARFHRVFSRFCQSRKIHYSTLLARPRWLGNTQEFWLYSYRLTTRIHNLHTAHINSPLDGSGFLLVGTHPHLIQSNLCRCTRTLQHHGCQKKVDFHEYFLSL